MLFLLAALLGAASAHAEKRVALVIGNAVYWHADRLANSEADAAAVAAMFAKLGFETAEAKTNLSLASMKRALADFELAAKGADIAVIYYSGHGVQIGGQDYLVPIDAELAREVDVDDETVALDRAIRAVSFASKLRLVIVDACRDNPFRAWSGAKSVTRGLAPPANVPALASTLIAFAASPGEQAMDGPPGGDSPYAAALVKRLPTPGLDIELALRMVTKDVYDATSGRQTPYKAGSLVGQTLALVEGAPPSARSELSALSAARLCAIAVDAIRGEWDERPPLHDFVEEANRRGLSVDACRRETAPSLPPGVPPRIAPVSAGLATIPNNLLCEQALDAPRTSWDDRSYFASKVAEARRRGLSVDDCRAAAGYGGAQAPSSPKDLTGLSSNTVCNDALNSAKTDWNSQYIEKRAEAQRRGLDVAACRSLLGLDAAAPTGTSAPISSYDLSSLQTSAICTDAINIANSNWDDRPEYAAKVGEAKRRGLSVVDCLSEWPTKVICANALNASKTDWEERPRYAPAVAAARKHELSVVDCRAAVADAASPQPTTTPTPTPTPTDSASGAQTLIATYVDWSVYTARIGDPRICFSFSQPKQRAPTEASPPASSTFIADRPGENVLDEVSVLMGVEIAQDAPVAVIDGATFEMMAAEGRSLWIKDRSRQAAMIAAMRSGATMTIRVTQKDGSALSETYSLIGVSQAIDRAAKECA